MTLNNNKDIRKIFSQNLKYYRKKEKLTQSELAEMVSLTDKYISDIERGLYSPSLNTIDSIANALRIETHLLLKFDEDHVEKSIIE